MTFTPTENVRMNSGQFNKKLVAFSKSKKKAVSPDLIEITDGFFKTHELQKP
jgi:hypothetical protein